MVKRKQFVGLALRGLKTTLILTFPMKNSLLQVISYGIKTDKRLILKYKI